MKPGFYLIETHTKIRNKAMSDIFSIQENKKPLKFLTGLLFLIALPINLLLIINLDKIEIWLLIALNLFYSFLIIFIAIKNKNHPYIFDSSLDESYRYFLKIKKGFNFDLAKKECLEIGSYMDLKVKKNTSNFSNYFFTFLSLSISLYSLFFNKENIENYRYIEDIVRILPILLSSYASFILLEKNFFIPDHNRYIEMNAILKRYFYEFEK